MDATVAAAVVPGAAGQPMNVACGERVVLLDVVRAIGDAVGVQIELTFEEARLGDVRESVASIAEARRVLGYEPRVGFQDGVRRTAKYLLESEFACVPGVS